MPTHDAPAPSIPTYRAGQDPDPAATATRHNAPPVGAWVRLASFHSDSGDHRPAAFAALRWSPRALLLWFVIEDRYVLVRHTGYQQNVCQDSCVEFFFSPDLPVKGSIRAKQPIVIMGRPAPFRLCRILKCAPPGCKAGHQSKQGFSVFGVSMST